MMETGRVVLLFAVLFFLVVVLVVFDWRGGNNKATAVGRLGSVVSCDQYSQQISGIFPFFLSSLNTQVPTINGALQQVKDVYGGSFNQSIVDAINATYFFRTNMSIATISNFSNLSMKYDQPSNILNIIITTKVIVPWNIKLSIDSDLSPPLNMNMFKGGADGNFTVDSVTVSLRLSQDGTAVVTGVNISTGIEVTANNMQYNSYYIHSMPFPINLYGDAVGSFVSGFVSSMMPDMLKSSLTGPINDAISAALTPIIGRTVDSPQVIPVFKSLYFYCFYRPEDAYYFCRDGFCVQSECRSGDNCYKNDSSCGGSCPPIPDCGTLKDKASCERALCRWDPPGECNYNIW